MIIKPINKNILLEEIKDSEQKTQSGIIVHSTKVRDGKFVKICKVTSTASDIVKAGEKVIVNAYGPQQVSFDPVQYIAKEMDILAVIE